MTTNISGSAKIYTFPPRGRFAMGSQVAGERDSDIATGAAMQPSFKVASGSGWYHEAAVQEAAKADPRRKN
jgi:Protein of unknown function (DUF2735)